MNLEKNEIEFILAALDRTPMQGRHAARLTNQVCDKLEKALSVKADSPKK